MSKEQGENENRQEVEKGQRGKYKELSWKRKEKEIQRKKKLKKKTKNTERLEQREKSKEDEGKWRGTEKENYE